VFKVCHVCHFDAEVVNDKAGRDRPLHVSP
jgi:hypothetical protein